MDKYHSFACDRDMNTTKYSIGENSKKLLEYVNEIRRVEHAVTENAKEEAEREGEAIPSVEFVIRMIEMLGRRESYQYSRFASWKKDSLGALYKISFHLFAIASKESINAKKQAIAAFALDAGLYMNPFAIMPDEKFNLIPAEHGTVRILKQGKIRKFEMGPWKDPKKLEVWRLWNFATTFGRHIAEAPKRLKVCPFCKPPRLFWDGVTKPANMHFCGKLSCKKKYNVARKQKERRKK